MQSPTPDASITALPTSITSQLSPEVHNIILSNFRHSKQQLTSFSFVCKTWLQLCRDFLFAEIEYRADFAQFLTSSPHAALTVAPHIRVVVLRRYAIDHKEKLHDLSSILCLPNITSLHVERTSLGTIMARPETFPFRRIASVETSELSLDTVSWDTIVDTTTDQGPLPHTHLKPSSLKKLFLSFCHNRIVMNWLLYGVISDSNLSGRNPTSLRSFSSLTTLSLPDILPQEIDVLGVILALIGETLEHLEIGICQLGNQQSSPVGRLLLAQNTRLKTITFNRVTLFQFPSPVPQNTAAESSPSSTSTNLPYRWIPDLISTAISGTVHAIRFKIWLSAEDQLNLLPWMALNIAITDIGISKLDFEISGVGRDNDLVVSWFRKRLAIDSTNINVEYNFVL